MGFEDDKKTRVIACRLAFGEVKKLEELTRQRRETHKETAAPAARGGGGGGERWEKGLKQTQIATFRHQVDRGAYRGFDDPFFLKVVARARANNER
jgi:hypothetical protein